MISWSKKMRSGKNFWS